MLEYMDKKLPFAIPTPILSDILPSENGERVSVSSGLSLQGKPPISNPIELCVSARIAQGAYLLGHVIDRVSAVKSDISSCGAAHVDMTLRSWGMDLLKPAGHSHLCWPYAICLRYLSALDP